MIDVLDAPAKFNSFFDELPKAATRVDDWMFVDKMLSGKWSSAPEGDVIAGSIGPQQLDGRGMPVDIDMRVHRGTVTGAIGSGGLGKHYVFSEIQIDGQVSAGNIEGIAWDAIGGEKVALAKFELQQGQLDGEPVLLFRIIDQAKAFFPARATLWQTDAIRPGELKTQFFRTIVEQRKARQRGALSD
ncbi:hypothetical protein [Methyloceanibacter methanicus]|uniref:hypothetical protein n=1 Tax=Methyloceanibacter methanicus TaxID=1774968 RepID=UPI00114CA490|nr:hypothetical protein [Methyloceanibacter methanicus]